MSLLVHYLKNYGLLITLNTIFYYVYRVLKQPKLDSQIHDIVIETNGYKLSVVPDDPGISSELRIFNIHEPLSTKLTLQELKEGMVCLDVGSNIGYYALMESNKVGKTGRVIAIEPSPKNYEYLKRNIGLSKFNNVELYNFAAGEKDGEVKFFIHKKSNHCSVIKEGQKIPESGKVINVSMRSMDSFVEEKQLDRVDFVRMDVEGFEVKIFEGMWNVIKKFQPIIQMEFHYVPITYEEKKLFFKKIKSLGYEIIHFIPRDLDRPITGKMSYLKNYDIDCVMEMLDKGKLNYNFIIFLKPNLHQKS